MISYKEIKQNQKLNSFIQINICKICGSKIPSKAIIGVQGGNMDFCYSCNVKRGLIK